MEWGSWGFTLAFFAFILGLGIIGGIIQSVQNERQHKQLLQSIQQEEREKQQKAAQQAEYLRAQQEQKKLTEQEMQGFQEYLTSKSQYELPIKHFIENHYEQIEKVLLDIRNAERFFLGAAVDDALNEPIDLLTKTLTENTAFGFDSAKKVVHKAITITLFKEWVADFKKENAEFCAATSTEDKYERIKSFRANYRKYRRLKQEGKKDFSSYSKLQSFAMFLFLYDVNCDFNIDFSSLRKIKSEYTGIRSRILHEEVAKMTAKSTLIGMDDIDLMEGNEFEHYVAKLFEKMGYKTEVTKQSGDYGIDVIARKDNTSIGIQAKRYATTLGNKAVQEVVGGKLFYNVDKVMVVTN
ncbi:MAG: restriction endonuclease, partial [Clostridiales bacterium]|nr:restriction endonuclease [Clostridiales bacterium]